MKLTETDIKELNWVIKVLDNIRNGEFDNHPLMEASILMDCNTKLRRLRENNS